MAIGFHCPGGGDAVEDLPGTGDERATGPVRRAARPGDRKDSQKLNQFFRFRFQNGFQMKRKPQLLINFDFLAT